MDDTPRQVVYPSPSLGETQGSNGSGFDFDNFLLDSPIAHVQTSIPSSSTGTSDTTSASVSNASIARDSRTLPPFYHIPHFHSAPTSDRTTPPVISDPPPTPPSPTFDYRQQHEHSTVSPVEFVSIKSEPLEEREGGGEFLLGNPPYSSQTHHRISAPNSGTGGHTPSSASQQERGSSSASDISHSSGVVPSSIHHTQHTHYSAASPNTGSGHYYNTHRSTTAASSSHHSATTAIPKSSLMEDPSITYRDGSTTTHSVGSHIVAHSTAPYRSSESEKTHHHQQPSYRHYDTTALESYLAESTSSSNAALKQVTERLSHFEKQFVSLVNWMQTVDERLENLERTTKKLMEVTSGEPPSHRRDTSHMSGKKKKRKEKKRTTYRDEKAEKELVKKSDPEQLESDEALARRLQEQFNAEEQAAEQPTTPLSDEEYARRLQQAFLRTTGYEEKPKTKKEKQEPPKEEPGDGRTTSVWSRLFGTKEEKKTVPEPKAAATVTTPPAKPVSPTTSVVQPPMTLPYGSQYAYYSPAMMGAGNAATPTTMGQHGSMAGYPQYLPLAPGPGVTYPMYYTSVPGGVSPTPPASSDTSRK